MFSGIVEELGRLESLCDGRLRITATRVVDGVEIGESIAVNGCCLTVVEFGEGWWEADVSDETLSRASLATLGDDDGVNLERAVRASDRLGGHIVQGHVDGVGEIVDPVPDLRVRVRVPDGLLRYLVEKGSVTVDGVSLTILQPPRRRLHRCDHPAHRLCHDAGHQTTWRPRECRGRRDGQVRRTVRVGVSPPETGAP